MNFLSVTKQAEPFDIILISGDAYIDHPSFGPALIGRYLEAYGYSVGIIAQPVSDSDFTKLGRPRLFFGISSGNMDSMVNHFTAQKKIRSEDAYSPNGKTGLRPNRATIVYSHKIKSLFKNVPIVIGGIEASLRRIPHYDFWSDKVRNSILLDSKADILVYGQGEKTILEIAGNITDGVPDSIRGTAVISKTIDDDNGVSLPEFSKQLDKEDFLDMTNIYEDNFRTNNLYMKFQNRYIKHNRPAKPMTQKEIDFVYDLPFTRLPHPQYKGKKLPAFEQIKNSITSHRGCFGGCNFCAIGNHQGKTISSRSIDSVKKEVSKVTKTTGFNGTISDVGGPSANMYGMFCKKNISEICPRNSCIYPNICPNLEHSHKPNVQLLKRCDNIEGVNHLFVASGIRFDIALNEPQYISQIAEKHTGGLLKLAPEHTNDKVLHHMFKPSFEQYSDFVKKFFAESRRLDKKQFVVPYIIVGHPGSTLKETLKMAVFLKKNNIKLKHIQEFTPTPMSISTMMYYTGKDLSGKELNIPKGREIKLQKALVQWFIPNNKKYIIEALKRIKRTDLLNFFLGKL
jgi:uncharacterized radical SAM protein YgiQ